MGNKSFHYTQVQLQDTDPGIYQQSIPSINQIAPTLRELVNQGNIEDCINILQLTFPDFLESPHLVYISLHGQMFIEILRRGDSLQALKYAQHHLVDNKLTQFPVSRLGKDEYITIQDLSGLLCYDPPQNSVLGYLMGQDQRERISRLLFEQLTAVQNQRGILTRVRSMLQCFRSA